MSKTNKKYEFTGETCVHNGVELHRIRAVKGISGVAKAGELGGWLESEDNLSQDGTCWVSGEAKVYGNAKVYRDAKVYGSAEVFGNAKVHEEAEVCENAKVYGYAEVSGRAKVYGRAEVYGYSDVYGNSTVRDDAKVHETASVFNYAELTGQAELCEKAKVYDCAAVGGHAKVCGCAELNGYTKVSDGVLKTSSDCITMGPIGSRNAYTTFNLTTGTVQTGCFKGTLDEFEKAIEETHKGNEYAVMYNMTVEFFRKLITVKGLASGELSS